MEELQKSLAHAHKEIENLKRHMDMCLGHNTDFDRRINTLEKHNAELKCYTEDLEDYILSLDSATRRKNIVISGLNEGKKENSASLPLTVYKFLQPYVQTLELSDIDCAYRLGSKSKNKSRPILCKFVKEKVRNEVTDIRSRLNEEDSKTKIYLNDDLPQQLNERRAALRSIVRIAKSKSIPASTQGDRVTVNNITYTHKNLDCLPQGVTLEDVNVVEVKGGYAFSSEHAWLSNFYPVKIKIQGKCFNSAEQAYQYTRAMCLKDSQTATMIMRARNAKESKKLSYNVESNDQWDADKIDVMRQIVTEKFLQNPIICEKLVGTGQAALIER